MPRRFVQHLRRQVLEHLGLAQVLDHELLVHGRAILLVLLHNHAQCRARELVLPAARWPLGGLVRVWVSALGLECCRVHNLP